MMGQRLGGKILPARLAMMLYCPVCDETALRVEPNKTLVCTRCNRTLAAPTIGILEITNAEAKAT
jgi:ribosomal protein L33